MPTNILRKRSREAMASPDSLAREAAGRIVLLTAGGVQIRIRLLDTITAGRVWQALPLYSTAETWGQAVRFELPIETGREDAASLFGLARDIHFWSEESRVIVAFGPTPISAPGEIRLPSPCNVWAKAIDDVSPLITVTPGEKVSLTISPEEPGA
jgi:uncharacterized protein